MFSHCSFAKYANTLEGIRVRFVIGKIKGIHQNTLSNGSWEALDSLEWIVFDARAFLDTSPTHSEMCFNIGEGGDDGGDGNDDGGKETCKLQLVWLPNKPFAFENLENVQKIHIS